MSPPRAPDFFSLSRSRSNSSPRTPTRQSSSSARRSSPRSPTGPIATRACFLATAPARPSYSIAAAARTASSAPTSAATGSSPTFLFMPGGGCKTPITRENVDRHLHTIHMSGKEVYKQAVIAMLRASKIALEQAGLTIDDIACVIPHQANLRIIEAIADRLKIPLDRFFVNLDRYGNTSAAAVAIALDEANRTGRIKPGDYILMVVFGGGLTWASTVIEW